MKSVILTDNWDRKMGIKSFLFPKPTAFSIIQPFQQAFMPLIGLNRAMLSRQWPGPFPLLRFLSLFSPHLPVMVPPFVVHSYPSPAQPVSYPFNLSLYPQINIASAPHSIRETHSRSNLLPIKPMEHVQAFPSQTVVQPNIRLTPAMCVIKMSNRHYIRGKAESPGNGKIEISNVLMTKKLKERRTEMRHSSLDLNVSLNTSRHFHLEETENRLFRLVENQYVNSPQPVYNKPNLISRNGQLTDEDGRIERGKPGLAVPGKQNVSTLQFRHSFVKTPNGKTNPLHLDYVNPKLPVTDSIGNPAPQPINHTSSHSHNTPFQNSPAEALPFSQPDTIQTGNHQQNKINLDLDRLTDRVYSMLERKMRTERERRGW